MYFNKVFQEESRDHGIPFLLNLFIAKSVFSLLKPEGGDLIKH